jgi:hypothetical protein
MNIDNFYNKQLDRASQVSLAQILRFEQNSSVVKDRSVIIPDIGTRYMRLPLLGNIE